MVSPSNKYAVVFNSTNNALVSWDSMLSTDLPFTEETSALAPNPSVSELSIINSDPTEKLLVLFIFYTSFNPPPPSGKYLLTHENIFVKKNSEFVCRCPMLPVHTNDIPTTLWNDITFLYSGVFETDFIFPCFR